MSIYNKSQILKTAWQIVRYERKMELFFKLPARPLGELLAEALVEAWKRARIEAGMASKAELRAERIKKLRMNIAAIENTARWGSQAWNSLNGLRIELKSLEAA